MREYEYELSTRFSTRKSFYGKARVRVNEDDNKIEKSLISYTTMVAKYIYDKGNNTDTYIYIGHYSATTTTHQKEFFLQEGLTEKQFNKLVKVGTLTIDNN